MSQWAGSLECGGRCGRKRLIADEFSKKMLERRKKAAAPHPPPSLHLSHAPPLPPQDPSAAIRCKMCVEAEAEAERKVAAERQATSKREASDEPADYLCSSCSRSLPASAFNRTQLSKGVEKQRCQECVSSAEKEANAAALKSRQQKLEEAHRHARTMEATGSAAQRCMAAASVAALEAQAVTGVNAYCNFAGRLLPTSCEIFEMF
ncbi:MAG: hypothetical protein SGPRY_008048 [Prymnesium sp.]